MYYIQPQLSDLSQKPQLSDLSHISPGIEASSSPRLLVSWIEDLCSLNIRRDLRRWECLRTSQLSFSFRLQNKASKSATECIEYILERVCGTDLIITRFDVDTDFGARPKYVVLRTSIFFTPSHQLVPCHYFLLTKEILL
jgi:hypothetical protein